MTERKVAYFPEINERTTELTLKAVKARTEEAGMRAQIEVQHT